MKNVQKKRQDLNFPVSCPVGVGVCLFSRVFPPHPLFIIIIIILIIILIIIGSFGNGRIRSYAVVFSRSIRILWIAFACNCLHLLPSVGNCVGNFTSKYQNHNSLIICHIVSLLHKRKDRISPALAD